MKPSICRLAVLATTRGGGEFTERRERQALGAQLAPHHVRHPRLERSDVGLAHVRDEYREHRAGVREQQAFAPGKPKQVHVPVVIVRLAVDKVARAEHRSRLCRAAQDHDDRSSRTARTTVGASCSEVQPDQWFRLDVSDEAALATPPLMRR